MGEVTVDMEIFEKLLDAKLGKIEQKIDEFNAVNEKDHAQYRKDIDGLYEREMYTQKALNDRLDKINDKLTPMDSLSVTIKSQESEMLRVKDSINQIFEENKHQEKDISGLAVSLRREIGDVDRKASEAVTTLKNQGGAVALILAIITAGATLAIIFI